MRGKITFSFTAQDAHIEEGATGFALLRLDDSHRVDPGFDYLCVNAAGKHIRLQNVIGGDVGRWSEGLVAFSA